MMSHAVLALPGLQVLITFPKEGKLGLGTDIVLRLKERFYVLNQCSQFEL